MSFGHFLQQTAQIAKYAFDHVLIDNRNGPAADSFDFMRLNAVNRRVFMNVRSEFMSSPSAEARRLLHRSNLAEIVSTAPMILDAMKRLVKALGLRNSIDDDQLITQQYMDRNYDTIMYSSGQVVRYAPFQPGEAIQAGQQLQGRLQAGGRRLSLCQESPVGMALYVGPAKGHHQVQVEKLAIFGSMTSGSRTEALAASGLWEADLLHHDSVVALKGDINIHVRLHGANLVGSQEALTPTALPALLQDVHSAPVHSSGGGV
ncbi:MAG: hypothetical protein FRX49_08917 [Trebouxia sp. A1-2]|nr:MAG: hypothetical protein FRX49_08917 [Trebouxia sp. A1-2]